MGDNRARPYSNGNHQIEPHYGPQHITNPHDHRSYSATYASSYSYAVSTAAAAPPSKKGNSIGGSTSKSWSFNDAEFQRKKRVASYRVYSVEGKVKGSFRKSLRWIKNRYTQVVYGWW